MSTKQVTQAFAVLALSVVCISFAGCKAVQLLTVPDRKIAFGGSDSTGLVILDLEVICDPNPNFSFKESYLSQILDDALDVYPRLHGRGGTILSSEGISVEGTHTKSLSGKILFPVVPPGKYIVQELKARKGLTPSEQRELYNCQTESATDDCPHYVEYRYTKMSCAVPEMHFSVTPGEIVFLGRMVIIESHEPPFHSYQEDVEVVRKVMVSKRSVGDTHDHDDERTYKLIYKAEYEIESLKQVAAVAKGTQWEVALAERIAALETKTGR